MTNREGLREMHEAVPLPAEKISELESLLSQPAEWAGRTVSTGKAFITQMHISARQSEPYVLRNQVDWVKHNGAAMRVFTAIYPEVNEDELDNLIRIDGASLARLDGSPFDPDNQWYDMDWRDTRPFIFGTSERLQLYRFRSVAPEEVPPVVATRMRKGMPRPMQLIAAASVISRFSGLPENLKYDVPAFKHVPEIFRLSESELHAVCRIAGSLGSPSRVNQFILNDSEIADRFRSDSGELRLELIGGQEVTAQMLSTVFENIARGDTRMLQTWNNTVHNLGINIVETMLPFEQRRAMVLEKMSQQPRMPAEYLQEHISPTEVAEAARNVVQAYLDSELPKYGWYTERYNYTPAHAAIEFGVDDTPFRLQKMNDYRKLVSLMADTAPEGSELYDQAQAWLQRIADIDPRLNEWFEAYSREKHNRDLDPLPVDGWSGAPEEEEIIKAWGESRRSSVTKMEEIASIVREYLDARTPNSSF